MERLADSIVMVVVWIVAFVVAAIASFGALEFLGEHSTWIKEHKDELSFVAWIISMVIFWTICHKLGYGINPAINE